MQKYFLRSIPILFLSAVLSCSNRQDENPNLLDIVEHFSIDANRQYVFRDNNSRLYINVTIEDRDRQKVEAEGLRILINDQIVSQDTRQYVFIPSQNGKFRVKAELEGFGVSNELEIVVRERERIEIPLVFHVSEARASNARNILPDWIEALNFRFNHAESTNSTSSPGIFFKLAKNSPDGGSLDYPGLNVYPDSLQVDVFHMSESYMWDYFWDPDYYINVWITNVFRGASSAHLPIFNENTPELIPLIKKGNNPLSDLGPRGIIYDIHETVLLDQVISNTTLEHELGHLLGLKHLFPCTPDGVHDTPTYRSGTTGLKCDGSTELSENHMSYEGTRNRFTVGQQERMWFTLDYGKWVGQKGATLYGSRGEVNPEGNYSNGPMKMVKPSSTAKISSDIIIN